MRRVDNEQCRRQHEAFGRYVIISPAVLSLYPGDKDVRERLGHS